MPARLAASLARRPALEMDGLIAGELDDVTTGPAKCGCPGPQGPELARQVPVLAQRRPHRRLVLP